MASYSFPPGSHSSVSHNPILYGCPGHPVQKPCLRNGSFPAVTPASSYSSCTWVRFPCCPLDSVGHGRGIPDVLNYTNKSMVRSHGSGSTGNPLRPSLSRPHSLSCSRQNTGLLRAGRHRRRHCSSRLPAHWHSPYT